MLMDVKLNFSCIKSGFYWYHVFFSLPGVEESLINVKVSHDTFITCFYGEIVRRAAYYHNTYGSIPIFTDSYG